MTYHITTLEAGKTYNNTYTYTDLYTSWIMNHDIWNIK